jgi:hypothetical protein
MFPPPLVLAHFAEQLRPRASCDGPITLSLGLSTRRAQGNTSTKDQRGEGSGGPSAQGPRREKDQEGPRDQQARGAEPSTVLRRGHGIYIVIYLYIYIYIYMYVYIYIYTYYYYYVYYDL